MEPQKSKEIILQTKGLKKYFPILKGVLKRKVGDVKAVDGVNLTINKGETQALVGESGSGKTTLGKTLARIYKPTAGQIWFNGYEISKIKEKNLKRLYRRIQTVFQDPTSSLNPRRRIKDIIADPLVIHRIGTSTERREKIKRILNMVELPEDFLHRYPRALSGGQKQRVGIARALVMNPEFVVLDEPTSSLDVSVQAKIISLLKGLQKNLHLTYLFISHDLSLVRTISQHTSVMYLGKIIERAPTEELYKNPAHPYTKALLSAIPVVSDEELKIIPKKINLGGEIPSPSNVPEGCAFHTRCYENMNVCKLKCPNWIKIKKGHFVRCHLFSR